MEITKFELIGTLGTIIAILMAIHEIYIVGTKKTIQWIFILTLGLFSIVLVIAPFEHTPTVPPPPQPSPTPTPLPMPTPLPRPKLSPTPAPVPQPRPTPSPIRQEPSPPIPTPVPSPLLRPKIEINLIPKDKELSDFIMSKVGQELKKHNINSKDRFVHVDVTFSQLRSSSSIDGGRICNIDLVIDVEGLGSFPANIQRTKYGSDKDVMRQVFADAITIAFNKGRKF